MSAKDRKWRICSERDRRGTRGALSGQDRADDITVFDSSEIALQDLYIGQLLLR